MSEKSILNIANDFAGSRVYRELFVELDKLDIGQIVYTAIRSESLINKNRFSFKNERSKIIYSNILTGYDRFNFYSKIKKIVKDLEARTNVSKIELIHAHTWYSDGAVAYELFKKHNIPYVVTIRNTDLNVFYKYMLHLRSYGKIILDNAQKIVFVSEVYKSRFLELPIFLNNSVNFSNKIQVIYNGVDKYWIENVKVTTHHLQKNLFKILYIGKFDKGKNVPRLIKAVACVNKKINCQLTLVGGGGSDSPIISKYAERYDFIKLAGPVYEKSSLKNIFNDHDLFAMPSKSETFGLVYIEALSQNIPILNTINEGIYGMYKNVGESVEYTSIKSISNAIIKLYENYEKYDFSSQNIVKNHDWKNIAFTYSKLYRSILTTTF